MHTTIETLWKKGLSKSKIAAMTKHDWKTVAKIIKYLEQGKTLEAKNKVKRLDVHQVLIQTWLEHNISALRIHEKLREEYNVKVSYSTVKNYVHALISKPEVCIRFHTAPGEEAQVDFGYIGKTLDHENVLRKTWVFNMRLSYSRLDYYEIVYDQSVKTFLKCHQHAFEYFGGVVQRVKIDNLKSAVVTGYVYEPIYQSGYEQFSHYYGFEIIACRVRKPQEKGKVESGIKYFKINFIAGRSFKNQMDLVTQMSAWNEKSNQRIHGTTRKIPREVFAQEEKHTLISLPETPFEIPQLKERKVQKDSHVYIDYNYYSVPSEYVGQIVCAEIKDKLIKIMHEGNCIATHPICSGKGRFETNKNHYPKEHQNPWEHPDRYAEKMSAIGIDAQALFDELVKQKPRQWYRIVKGIIHLSKIHSCTVVNLACERAIAYQALEYRIIKSICENGSYALPLDAAWAQGVQA